MVGEIDRTRVGLVFKHPRVSAEHQATELRNAGASLIIEIGGQCPNWREAVRALRPGDVVYFYAAVMVPGDVKKMRASRPAQWTEFVFEVRERHASFVEVLTGLRSDKPKEFRQMNAETHRLFRVGGLRLPTSGRGPGKKPTPTPDSIKKIWTSRDYVTNEAALRHMPEGWTARMCRDRFGPSGRPWRRKRKT